MDAHDTPAKSALFLSAFFDELIRCGVRDVVVSPGSRSTPLSMIAYESDLRLFVDVDERGAAFFALGLAKASRRPVALICTSGTAVANYYPAILEAEISRVPLIVLTGDRPPRLQNLGAPQTCDQLKIFGDHVRHFQQMPLPGATQQEIAFARQMALVGFAKAVGSQIGTDDAGEPWYGCISNAGPVHFNFPFEEPLKPAMQIDGLFTRGRSAIAGEGIDPVTAATSLPDAAVIKQVMRLMVGKRTIVLCGEGSFTNSQEAERLLAWAHKYRLPLLADPLSNLRSYDDPYVIDKYDNIFGNPDCFGFELVIRFGRYPVSKACFSKMASETHIQIVVDAYETRDFNAATDLFIPCTPAAFVKACEECDDPAASADATQKAYAETWIARNNAETQRVGEVAGINEGFEGAFVHKIMELAPENSCVFAASSMAIRLVDTFYLKGEKRLTVLCNRGLNGIDGSVSSAIGASQHFGQTTFIVGDLALLHDLNALALQHELLQHHRDHADHADPLVTTDTADPSGFHSLIIVLLNNQGGGIFEMLPQKSADPYYERLFLTPQKVDFCDVAVAFDIPYFKATTTDELAWAYQNFCSTAGIHLVEVDFPAEGLKERYGDFLA